MSLVKHSSVFSDHCCSSTAWTSWLRGTTTPTSGASASVSVCVIVPVISRCVASCRSCPVYNGTCRQDSKGVAATVHMIVGTAGIGYDSPVWLPAAWSMSRFSSVFAYARVHVQGARDLQWSLVDVYTGAVLDSVHIHSNHTFPYHP